MACYMTARRHELGLKAINFAVPRDIARHIAQCALDSEMKQAAFMTRILAEAKPFPIEGAAETPPPAPGA